MQCSSCGAQVPEDATYCPECATLTPYGISHSDQLAVNTSFSSRSVLRSGKISGFTTGFNRFHTIGVVANGPQISVYIDQQYITQVSNSTIASGEVGMTSE
jgi:zinc-ribbon domain